MVLYQNGAEKAFQILYQRFSKKIYGYIRKKVQINTDDIFQEVFIKIHKSKHLYNKTLPVAPWFFTIAKNVITDEIRKTKDSKNRADIDLESLVTQDKVESNFSQFNPALAQLNEQQRAAIEMRYIDEKTFDEIASHLKTSPLNARKLISRGIKKMKTLFDKGGRHE